MEGKRGGYRAQDWSEELVVDTQRFVSEKKCDIVRAMGVMPIQKVDARIGPKNT